MQLNQKESGYVKELKEQEKLCIEKYQKAAGCAADGQLKNLFSDLAQKEQTHLDSLTQLEQGTATVPQQGGNAQTPTFRAVYSAQETQEKKNDCYLCTDALAGEKHVSALYDTSVFEFRDETARKLLNHIQSEEQAHGKMIYDYMAANAMY